MENDLQWLDHEPVFDEANIDPRLLDNARLTEHIGSWPTSEDSKNSNSVPSLEQAKEDVEKTYDPATSTQMLPSIPTPMTQDEGIWQAAPAPRHRNLGRRSQHLQHPQHMPPTPDTSSVSHQSGQRPSAYRNAGPTWQLGNPYSVLDDEYAQAPQDQDLATGTVYNHYQTFTPASSQSQAQSLDNDHSAPSPLAGRGPPQYGDGQPMQDQASFSGNFQGWSQRTVPPSEDIDSWTHEAYNVGSGANYTNVPSAASPPMPPNNEANGNGRAIAKSGPSTVGTFICVHTDCDSQFETKSALDHHARYHDETKRNKLCSICHKAFIFKKDVKRHMKTHSSERHIFCNKLGCPYREKGFKRQDHLERHVRNKHKVKEEP